MAGGDHRTLVVVTQQKIDRREVQDVLRRRDMRRRADTTLAMSVPETK